MKTCWAALGIKLNGDAEKNAKKLEKDVADMFKQFPPHTKESTGF